jgi:hypothetical protein
MEEKRRSWGEKRREEKERDVDVFYTRGRRKRRKRGLSVVKWDVNNLLTILPKDITDKCNFVGNSIGINDTSFYFLALF